MTPLDPREWLENLEIAGLNMLDLDDMLDDDEEENPDALRESALADMPDELPILPLRGMVVFPKMTLPLPVGQPRSIRLVEDLKGRKLVGLFTSKTPENDTPGPDDIYPTGTLGMVMRQFRGPDGSIRLMVRGLERIEIEEYTTTEPYLKARVKVVPEVIEPGLETDAMARNISDQFNKLADLLPNLPGDLLSSTLNVDDPLHTTYAVATYIRSVGLEEAQTLLEIPTLAEKMRKLIGSLGKEIEILELGRKIQADAQGEMEKAQREYYLREQIKVIQRELGDGDEATEVETFRKKIEEANMTEEAETEARRELDRLSRLPSAAAEYGVIRTYLDWLVSLPWDKRTEDMLDIARAREVLDEDHYGLADVKERILEFLAVRKLRKERAHLLEVQENTDYVRRERAGAILCFVGPPGVGKTSLGQSIARAMGRKFIRMSLGGVRDETEIRGFRRTYIGALPGRIVQTLRRAETRNPVILMDEIDKLGRDFRGDPASALLEVLDPEQNDSFRDHYMDVAFDLSEVFFITTANDLEGIPGPLRDRMEVITLTGYTEHEKVAIASQYLVPRQVRENGLLDGEVTVNRQALQTVIHHYTREAGVRSLEREIGRAMRKVVTQIAEGATDAVEITPELVGKLLGKPRYEPGEDLNDRTSLPGIATGLAWTPVGGEVLFVEAAQMAGGKGFGFQITGNLGEVMQESARIAMSAIRGRAEVLGIGPEAFEKFDVHLHVPAGAMPKDGPSAGVTIFTALASLLTGRPVRHNVAMTGEITLRGQVLPVGGIKDKVLAAHRLGVDTVILPRKNAKDIDDLPAEVRDQLTFVLVDRIDEVVEAALVPLDETESAIASVIEPQVLVS
ncbi:MAG: endopeptidase La [Anaerolineae bacterium]|nr:endopeptidase La [Anaerolineae bacterium]